MAETIDTRGLSCPQPVLDTMQALSRTSESEVKVLVDTDASKENVSRAAQGKGWQVKELKESDGEYHLTLRRG
ncbi:MAG: sulfurtransferase TusA family protein [Desulfonatronovibrionaceae bacterium]